MATNVRGFLGLTWYLTPFIPALAEHTSILTPLTNKECDLKFPKWMRAHQNTFDEIRKLVTDLETLTVIDYDNPTKKIFVTMDTSNRRTGAVLRFGETWESACPVAEDNAAADALSRMPNAVLSTGLTACTLTYTQSPPLQKHVAAGALHIRIDREFLKEIVMGYEEDTFAKQVQEGIEKGSIMGA
ncbi:hypothetical protein C0995_002267 [Termitomyces sp. Mi166|nr:hypothetical protein C0995_002267 [Termitomyces sp. Mi166\